MIADARGPRQRRRGRPEGPVQGHGRRQPRRRRALPPRRRGASRTRGSRIPTLDARDRRGARAAPRPDHVGRADPLVGRRRGAAVRAEVPEREAVALRHARSGCSSSTSAARQEGIELYGGGQFELGVGRGQIQILAALFSADGPNDVAPGGYNANEPTRRPRDEPAQAAARALRLPARRRRADRLDGAAGLAAFASARRSAGSSIRANASSQRQPLGRAHLGRVGRERAGGDDEEAQVEVVVLVPRDPVHVDVEQARRRAGGRRARSPRAPRAAPPRRASRRPARCARRAGTSAALRVVDEQRARAGPSTTTADAGEVRLGLVARERVAERDARSRASSRGRAPPRRRPARAPRAAPRARRGRALTRTGAPRARSAAPRGAPGRSPRRCRARSSRSRR